MCVSVAARQHPPRFLLIIHLIFAVILLVYLHILHFFVEWWLISHWAAWHKSCTADHLLNILQWMWSRKRQFHSYVVSARTDLWCHNSPWMWGTISFPVSQSVLLTLIITTCVPKLADLKCEGLFLRSATSRPSLFLIYFYHFNCCCRLYWHNALLDSVLEMFPSINLSWKDA